MKRARIKVSPASQMRPLPLPVVLIHPIHAHHLPLRPPPTHSSTFPLPLHSPLRLPPSPSSIEFLLSNLSFPVPPSSPPQSFEFHRPLPAAHALHAHLLPPFSTEFLPSVSEPTRLATNAMVTPISPTANAASVTLVPPISIVVTSSLSSNLEAVPPANATSAALVPPTSVVIVSSLLSNPKVVPQLKNGPVEPVIGEIDLRKHGEAREE